MGLAFSVPNLLFLTCSLASWLYVFMWQIFLKLTSCHWILDDFLFSILGLFLYIFSLWMFAIDHDGNPNRLSCLTCCLIYMTTGCLLVDCVCGLTYLYLFYFQWALFELNWRNVSLWVILLWVTYRFGLYKYIFGWYKYNFWVTVEPCRWQASHGLGMMGNLEKTHNYIQLLLKWLKKKTNEKYTYPVMWSSKLL